MTTNDPQRHWEHAWDGATVEQTGWYEESAEASLRLLDQCEIGLAEPVVDAGAGASTFIDALLERGFDRVVAIDIAAPALDALSRRLGVDRARVEMVVDDVTNPRYLDRLRDVALWHDRAVLHFLTDPVDRAAYVDMLHAVMKPGGYVIIATFTHGAPTQCSGLDVLHMDVPSLEALLGHEFELLDSFDFDYATPRGEVRPFVYTLFRRRALD